MKLNTLFATDLYKYAQLSADDTQFEQDFSKLAYMFIQDRAAALMPYILGFETVQRNEDGSRAVGMFGFKIGEDYYYVPAFFLNNQVKGIDMLLNKKTNTFIPLTEDWIDYILNRQTIELGDKADTNNGALNGDFETPNFDFLQRPTVGPLGGPKYGSKYASAEVDDSISLSSAWNTMQRLTKLSIEKDAEFGEAWEGFVRACQKRPMKKSSSADTFKKFASEIGGPQVIDSMLKSLGSNVKFASAAMHLYDNVSSFYTDSFSKNCFLLKKARENSDMTLVKVVDTPAEKDDVAEILADGFKIIDKRKDSDKSVVYDEDYTKRINSPDKSGVYEVLLPGGEFKKMYILYRNRIADNKGRPERSTFVFDPESKKYTFTTTESIFTKDTATGTIKDIYGDAKSLSDIPLHSKIMFIGPNGTCLGPFNTGSVSGNSDSRPIISGSWDWESDVHGSDYYFSCEDAEIASYRGNPKLVGNRITIPSDWKFFELKEDSYDNGSYKSGYLSLGSDATISDALIKKSYHELELHSDDGSNFYAKFDRMYPTEEVGYKQASINLVTKLGLDPKDAKRLLKKASSDRVVKCTIKMAQLSNMVGVSMGSGVPQTASVDPYTGIPVYDTPYLDETKGQFTNAPTPNGDNVPGENIGGEMERNSGSNPDGTPIMDNNAMQLAQQAAQAGQKKVFDQAAIGGLAKVYDTSAVVDSYLPEFTQTLDRLGRILFLYYWKHDDFINRYGTDDTIRIEDTLRGVFKSLGDLTLDLKQKAIGKEDAEAVTL